MLNPGLNSTKLIRALRLMLALGAGFTLIHHLKISTSSWVMVSTTIVLFDQETVGGTLNRGRLRFLATLYGALLSILYLILFPHHPLIIWGFIAITTIGYGYLYMGSKDSYIGLLGVVTVSVILVNTGIYSPLATAMYRLSDILIGILIAIIMMVFFFPCYAIDKAEKLLQAALIDIKALMETMQNQTEVEAIRHHILTIEAKFIKDVVKFNQNMEDAKHEIKARRTPELIELNNRSILQIRRLYRLMIVMYYYELDAHQLMDHKLQQLLTLIINRLEHLAQLAAGSKISVTNSPSLLQLAEQITCSGFNKTIHYFIDELQQLEQYLHRLTLLKLRQG